MKKLVWIGLLASFLTPVSTMAQSAFDGTWKVDTSIAQLTKKPDVYLLQADMFNCKSCVPPVTVKADGQDQKVTGHPYYDSMSIKIVDDHTIEETDKKSGKTVATSRWIVSPDGNTLFVEFSNSAETNAVPVSGKGEETRIAKGPANSHAISGSWRESKLDNLSDNAILLTLKLEGDTLSMNTPTGASYSAKLDETDTPYEGDPGITSVSIKRLGKNCFQETDKRDGKVISVAKITVAPDGRSMTIAVTDKLHGTTSVFPALKQ
jgi:hypothetical protein